MLNVFITIDTELWPAYKGWPRRPLPTRKTDFQPEYEACLQGRTHAGDFGLPFQLRILNENGLKAVYLTEPLFSEIAGLDFLRQIVNQIQEGGQEIGLHPHTEWLGEIRAEGLPVRFGPAIHGYDQAEQKAIIQFALARLRAVGAQNIYGYRAGGYGANQATLGALADASIRFDTSYNRSYPESFPDWTHVESSDLPRRIDTVWEIPVTNFYDYPGHIRHAQLCACSMREFEYLLLQAWRDKRQSFVIVMHGFELVRRSLLNDGRFDVEPNRVVIRRFERLCRFLGQHRDKFRTLGFADVSDDFDLISDGVPPLHSTLINTGLRQIEQIASRWI